MKRPEVLARMRVAGYHANTRMFTRLLLECRINRTDADNAFRKGGEMKRSGVPCGCSDCLAAVPTAVV